MNIIHATTAHPRTDVRIRVKEIASLAVKLDQSVGLAVQDGKGDEGDIDGVVIIDSGMPRSSRIKRIIVGQIRMWRTLRRSKPEIVHFHDPELIILGLVLRLTGVKTIYDVHEDLPRQMLGKYWIPLPVRRPVAWLAEVVERVAAHAFNGIVAATPVIAKRFPQSKTCIVQNFPILEEFPGPESVPYAERPPHFAYMGGITRARGGKEMVLATGKVKNLEARLHIAGNFSPPELEAEIRAMGFTDRAVFHGWLSRREVADLLGRTRAGLVVLHPTQSYKDAYPVKMFEYMAAGLPVIASDFPLWREIVEGSGCGVLVDPMDPTAIAEAMDWVLTNPEEAAAMGRRGRNAVKNKYNWSRESDKLVSFYRKLLGESSGAP